MLTDWYNSVPGVSRGHVVLTDWYDSVPGGSASTEAGQHGVGRQESGHCLC